MSDYIGYNNQSIINISSNEVGTQLLDKLSRISDDRRIQPLDKYDYIPYRHRCYYNEYCLQIGDCYFMIPPEFIMVTAESTTQSIITLRQENTQKEKHGHHRRTILVDLVFNGIDNLNGFEVDAPSHPDGSGGTSNKYYVDGLRPLLAQFKCAPFLPVTNMLINRTYGIYTVALQAITISTVNGFPDCMKAQITLQEVNMMPYLEVPDIAFSSMIDWDLFRYYYQSFLTEKHKYKRLQSLPKNKNFNRFKLSILDQTIFLDGKVTEGNILDVCLDQKIYGDEGTNYITWIDSETDGVNIKEFQCGYANILTNIQFAELSTPTLQYLGGMDTIYNITFETTDEMVIQKIEQCQTVNDLMIRNNPKLQGSIGFVKLESELTEFTGALFVMVDSVSTNTVPGFPDLYNVQINCVAYDIAQSEREDLHGFRPFDDYLGTGYGVDQSATYQNETIYNAVDNGLLRKIKQDNYAEWKLSQMEVYPDLRLPTYADVDSMISNINSFRSQHGLSQLPYSKYPSRPASSIHGFDPNNPPSVSGDMPKITSIARSDYHKYVDPDFYVFYPNSHHELNSEYTDLGIKEPKQQSGYTKHVTEYTFPTDTPTGTTNGAEIGGIDNALVEKFIKYCTDQIGHSYVWGAEGEVSDSKGLCFDCSGLVSWALKQCGISSERFTTSTIPTHPEVFTKIDRNSAQRGDILLRTNQHVAVYLGNNEVMHAKGKAYGCIKESLSSAGNFDAAYRINAFSSSGDQGSTSSSNTSGFHATDEFVGMVAQWEGFLGTATPKDGGMDIGYGFHNQFTENGKTVKVTSGMTMTKERADNILKGMLENMIPQTVAKLQQYGWNPSDFTNNQVLALTSYFFNRGFSNGKADQILNKSNSPNIAAIGNNLPNYWGSASYAKTGLINRRNKEKELFFSGSSGAETGGGDTGASSGPTLTTAEFNSICQKVKQAVGSEGSDAELAMAQMIYDRLTSGLYGNLSNVLNSIDNSSSMTGGSSSTVTSNVQSVFCNGAKKWPERTLYTLDTSKPIVEFERYDKAHIRRGSAGKHMFWGTSDPSSDIKYTISDSVNGGSNFANDGATVEKDIEVGTYSMSEVGDFGEPVLIKAKTFNDRSGGKKKYQNDLNNTYNQFNSSFHDQYQYSCRGRLVRAFPAFLFCLLDDDAAWYDGRKLWTNYYTHKSVIDIQVHATNDMAMDTATIVVTNTYHNLDRTESGLSDYSLMNDPDVSWLAKKIYEWTGLAISFGGAKLTSMMIQLHQVIYTHARLREGARAHLRMGYGSDPLSLAPMINGTITDCAVGDQISLVICSDGSELVANITSAKENDTNNGWLGLFGLGEDQEGSNIIANIICARQSWMSYISSNWFEGSKYSIEHYGLYFGQSMFGGNGEGDLGIIGDTAVGAGAGAATGAVIGALGGPIGAGVGAGIGALIGFGVSILTGGGGGSMKINIADLWDGYSEQFDLLMNVYRANYKGDLYLHEGAIFGADGETNVVFNKFNMTPWDVFQTCVQNVPEYIMKTGYHQFDSRLYYGLPFFMERFRYDYFGNSYDKIYQEAKTASQVHFIDSMDCIIDNQMKVSAKTTYTNIKVMYLRGSSSTSTMLIHSDDTIDNAKQKTKILDTPIVQDALGPDFLYEILGYKVGHDSARRTGISNLIYGWQGQYQGQIICTGCPGIKPHDHLLLNDSYSDIFGLCICREVVHSFSTNTGFCTSITPGMVAMSTDQNSGMTESVRSYLGLLSCFSAYTYVRKGMYANYESAIGALSDAYVLEESIKSNWLHSDLFKAGEFTVTRLGDAVMIAHTIRVLTKGAQIAREVVAYAKWAKKAVQVAGFGIKTIKAIATGAEIAGVGAAPETCGISLIVTLAAWLLVDVLLDAFFEWLDNKNTIVLLPLWREGYPFVTNVKDGKHILLCPSNSTATDEYD